MFFLFIKKDTTFIKFTTGPIAAAPNANQQMQGTNNQGRKKRGAPLEDEVEWPLIMFKNQGNIREKRQIQNEQQGQINPPPSNQLISNQQSPNNGGGAQDVSAVSGNKPAPNTNIQPNNNGGNSQDNTNSLPSLQTGKQQGNVNLAPIQTGGNGQGGVNSGTGNAASNGLGKKIITFSRCDLILIFQT